VPAELELTLRPNWILRTALRWWVEAEMLPPPVRRFRRRAIVVALRMRDRRVLRSTLPTRELLSLLSATEQKPLIVEIGTGWGLTAASLALAHADSEVITHDPEVRPGRSDFFALLPAAARRRITLVQGRGEEATLPDRPVDALFIDEAHERAGIVAVVSHWRPALAPGAVVVFDDFDTAVFPEVREAVAELGLPGRPSKRLYVAANA
jgi:predicted O-methyltransferase YrrM